MRRFVFFCLLAGIVMGMPQLAKLIRHARNNTSTETRDTAGPKPLASPDGDRLTEAKGTVSSPVVASSPGVTGDRAQPASQPAPKAADGRMAESKTGESKAAESKTAGSKISEGRTATQHVIPLIRKDAATPSRIPAPVKSAEVNITAPRPVQVAEDSYLPPGVVGGTREDDVAIAPATPLVPQPMPVNVPAPASTRATPSIQTPELPSTPEPALKTAAIEKMTKAPETSATTDVSVDDDSRSRRRFRRKERRKREFHERSKKRQLYARSYDPAFRRRGGRLPSTIRNASFAWPGQ